MKKRGFTLIELLAVIAILAILVVVAVPNVMRMYKSAKANSFINQAQNIYNSANNQLMMNEMSNNNVTRFYYAGETGSENPLSLKGNNKIYYDIEIDNAKITKIIVSTEEYSISIENMDGINITDITKNEVKESSEEGYISLSETQIEKTLLSEILKAHTPVSDATSSTYVTSGSGIDFGAVSSPTNGQGLYINNKINVAGDSTIGTIKYFRGGTYCAYTDYLIDHSGTYCTAAGGTWDSATYHCSLHDSQSTCESKGLTYYELKNNVVFGGYAWKIVRINADGSIRLLYNGTSPSARGTTAIVNETKYAFNSTRNDNTYIGYMYGGADQATYALTHTNTTNNTIKGVIDIWYQNNLASYASKLIDTGNCGDRSMRDGDLGYGINTTYYGAYVRLVTNKTPTYNCPNVDLYTLTTSSIGNKKLINPIGLITADEASYAGGAYGKNNYTYYLQSGGFFWTMSPCYFDGNASVWIVSSPGQPGGYNITVTNGVRPTVSLKSKTTITDGTGTMAAPWIIAD